MSERTRDSDRPSGRPSEPPLPPSLRPGPVEAVADMRRRLALVQHERRQAIYDAREAHGDRPSAVPEVHEAERGRDKLPTFDELTGPEAPRARWKLFAAVAGALVTLGELAREIVELVRH